MGVKHRRHVKGIGILSANLRKYRKEKGLTITKLANILELDYSQVARIERGVLNPRISTIFYIAEALDVPASKLFEEQVPGIEANMNAE